MRILRKAVLAQVAVLFLLSPARGAQAADPIEIFIDGTLRASGSSFVDLVDDVLSQENGFEDLQALPQYQITLNYLGIPQAIRVDAENNGARITLSIPSIGFSRVFVGATANDVEEQVEDFVEGEGAKQLAAFLEEVSARSPLALLDGNPRATTALLARGAFDRFGLSATHSRAGFERAQIARFGNFDLQAEVSGGSIDVDGFDSLSVVDGAITLAGDFEPGVGVSFSLLGQYRDLDGAELYDLGLELALPVHVFSARARSPLRWVVTPFFQAGAGVSVDLAAGGLMLGGGVVSALSVNLGPFEAMLANELVYYGGVPIDEIGGYDFDTELDQLLLKNGGKLAYHAPGASFVEAGLTFTNFVVSDAAVDFYTTPFVAVGLQLGIVRLRVGWESDFGDDYAAHISRGEIALRF